MNFHKLINPVMSDYDLIELSKIINVSLDDIYELKEITKPLPTKGTYFILMRKDDDGIGHWVCVDDNYYFDPCGLQPAKVLGNIKCNNIQYQGVNTSFCGVWCMLWLYCKQHNLNLLNDFYDLNIDV